MSAIRLNAAAIAANNLPCSSPPVEWFDLLSGVEGRAPVISRRDVIKAAGVAATVVTGALSSASLQPLIAPETGASARAAWLRAGANRAVLDPSVFAGRPALTVSQNGDWVAALTGARFPGTGVSADLKAAVHGSGALSRVRLTHALGGFDTEVGLSDWLSGMARASSGVDLAGLRIDLGDGARLEFAGRALATLAPDWSLRIEAPGVATVRGLGGSFIADAVTIALAAEGAVSLLSRRIARRTLITLESAAGAWSLPAPPAGARGGIDMAGCSFGEITVEAAETAAGSVYRALAARAASGSATFVPRGRAAARGAVPMPLSDVRYARLLDGSGAFHVAGSFPAEPMWITQERRALLVGGADWSPPFEMWGTPEKVSVSARPALTAISAAFEGGLASPVTFPAESRVTVNMGDTKRGFAAPLLTGLKGTEFGKLLEMPFHAAVLPLPLATTVTVLRPDDMLSLKFEFYHMSFVTDAGGSRFMPSPASGGQVAVRFPAQHILEEAIIDSTYQVAAYLKPPLSSYLAGESRLAFDVTGTRVTSGIEYSLAGMLNWTGFKHRVVPVAERTVPPTPSDNTSLMVEPAAGSIWTESPPETSIELPWGLYLSPYSDAGWRHRTTAFTKNSRTELWHTRLRGAILGGAAADEADGDRSHAAISLDPYELPPTVRAVWARHYQMHLDAAPDEVTLDPLIIQGVLNKKILTDGMFRNSFTTTSAEIGGFRNRWNIVDLSGRFHSEPIAVNNLMLSTLGGWLDSIGEWDVKDLKYTRGYPIPGSLGAWEHRATMGRDQYVKIVTLGNLFPFGHEAVELTITERRVDSATKMAFLGQKKFIVVKEPVREYAQEDEFHQRRFPFKRVEIKTKRTPALKIDWQTVSGLSNTDNAYWVYTDVPATRFMWQLEATDWDGVVHKFEMPLIWVKESTAIKGASTPSPAPATTLGACSTAMRGLSVTMNGLNIAFAKTAGGDDSARVMPTNYMKFEAHLVEPNTLGEIRYYPLMYQANVSLDAIEEMTNQTAGTWIRIADIYRYNGYGGTNATGKVIAALASTKTVGFPADLSGGVATPIPRITGISATKGTFGGDETSFGGGEFDPMQIFDALNAELFGGITLVDLIKVASGGLDLGKMPVFKKVADEATKTLTISYEWTVPITNDVIIFVPGSTCTLTLRTIVRKSLGTGGPEPSYEVTGTIGPFELVLLPPGGGFDALHIQFGLFTFASVNGASPTVNPDITDVTFGADLKYLAKLAEYMGGLSGSSAMGKLAERDGKSLAAATIDAGPLKIDVSGTGIKASLTIAIPDLAIGVFSLKNMSVSLGLTIPFTGDVVTLDFGFCSREAPFELLVMIYGGGGYVLMTFDPAGMRALEIGMEFGVGCAFGIGGIASGHVEVKGGLSVRYERRSDGEYMEFRVYIRIQGELDILGLISVTLTFYLELAYKTFPKQSNPALTGDELTGTATLTIEIEIVFFTIPIELSVTKTLAGDDPRFGDGMDQPDWDEYCEAFALAQLGA